MNELIHRRNVMLAFVVVASLALAFFESTGGGTLTGYATEGTTVSNVTISKFLAIEFSPGLNEGIQFGSVNTLPATDINASHNYDGPSSGTGYYINVSTDGNTNIDFCIKANTGLTSAGLDVIGLGNETYSNSTSTNATIPLLASQTPLTTSYVKSGANVAVGTANYWRFWLDIPAAQPSGDYNNTVSFKGVSTGLSC